MIERRRFSGGMNFDDVVDFIREGDYYVANNCRVGRDKDGRGGAVKPISSTKLEYDEVIADRKVVGSITDEVKGRVYFFTSHATNSAILAWDRKSNAIYTVLKESNVTGTINLRPENFITGVALIGDYLYWTDNYHEPRRIDVERGIKTNHSSYVSQDGAIPTAYTVPVAQYDISVARRVPRYVLNATKIVSEDESGADDVTYNLIERDSFQFAYRYIYRSGEISTLGAYSKIIPQNMEDDDFDAIRIELDKREPIDSEVQKIEFMVRKNNIGSWNIIKTLDREVDSVKFSNHNSPSSSPLTFYFYNDNAGIPVADEESYVPYFDVPIVSGSLEIADTRLFLGDNLKGYDYPKGMDIILGTTVNTGEITGVYYLLEWTSGSPSEAVVLYIPESFGSVAGWYPTPFSSSQFNSNSLDVTPTLDIADRYPVIDHNIPPEQLLDYLNPVSIDNTVTEYTFATPVVSGLGSFFDAARVFRTGKKYKVHVLFYDYAGRNAGVMHEPEEIIIPSATYEQTDFVTEITWLLQNDPSFIPLWAESYSIVRSRVTEPFIATYVDDVLYGDKDEDGTYDLSDTAYIEDVHDAIGWNLSELTDVGIGYIFQEGDVLKAITDLGVEHRLRIIGTQGTYVLTEPKNIGSTVGETYYIEIITPRTEDDYFWEVGVNYRVLNAGTGSRTLAVSTGVLTGDTFVVQRSLASVDRAVQAMNPNNKFWSMWPQDYGRPTALLFSKQKRFESELAWSSTFFPSTQTNGLNMMLSGDVRAIDSSIGSIRKLVFTSRMQDYGTVMLAIGDTEVVSIYLGRAEFYNAEEGGSVLTSVNVVGSVNVLRGGFGTVNPESVIENDGDVYWFSAIKASFVRYNRNGAISISDEKFSTVAAWLSEQVLMAPDTIPGDVKFPVIGGWDDFNKEYLVTIQPRKERTAFPQDYEVMDIEEDVPMDKTVIYAPKATLEAGEIYKFTFRSTGTILLTVKVNDLFYGEKTFSGAGEAGYEFQFIAAESGEYEFIIGTVPAIGTISKTYWLTKQKENPYIGTTNVPKTWAFNEEQKRWASMFPFVPEWFGRIGDRLLSFKNGSLYTHNEDTVGNFYGVEYPASISFPFNIGPNAVKRPQSITIEANEKPKYIHLRTEEPNIQSTDIVADEIEVDEGVFSAAFQRDRLSPNVSGTAEQKLKTGDVMKGRFGKVLVEWEKGTKFVTRIINIIFRDSPGHKL